jgi:hypothetical protein
MQDVSATLLAFLCKALYQWFVMTKQDRYHHSQNLVMSIGKPWILALATVLFITLGLHGIRLPRLNVNTHPRPVRKAIIEVPSQALKSLKSSSTAAPQHSFDTDPLDVVSAYRHAALDRFMAVFFACSSTVPAARSCDGLLPSRAPPPAV